MATLEPLLAFLSPSRPQFNSTRTIINSIVLLAIYFLIKDNPVCDQPLVLWMKFLFAVLTLDVLVEVLKFGLRTTPLTQVLRALNGLVGVGVWVCGHWPVYESEVCDVTLWKVAFGFELLVDILTGIVVLV